MHTTNLAIEAGGFSGDCPEFVRCPPCNTMVLLEIDSDHQVGHLWWLYFYQKVIFWITVISSSAAAAAWWILNSSLVPVKFNHSLWDD